MGEGKRQGFIEIGNVLFLTKKKIYSKYGKEDSLKLESEFAILSAYLLYMPHPIIKRLE